MRMKKNILWFVGCNLGKIDSRSNESGVGMEKQNELKFNIYLLYSIAEAWKKKPAEVYEILNRTEILDGYILPCYDTLHTQGKECLVEDITEFAREKGELV